MINKLLEEISKSILFDYSILDIDTINVHVTNMPNPYAKLSNQVLFYAIKGKNIRFCKVSIELIKEECLTDTDLREIINKLIVKKLNQPSATANHSLP